MLDLIYEFLLSLYFWLFLRNLIKGTITYETIGCFLEGKDEKFYDELKQGKNADVYEEFKNSMNLFKKYEDNGCY